MATNPSIDDVIQQRRTKRGFLDKPVPLDMVKDILSVAAHAPSSSNTQPWCCHVVTGAARERLTQAAVAAYPPWPARRTDGHRWNVAGLGR